MGTRVRVWRAPYGPRRIPSATPIPHRAGSAHLPMAIIWTHICVRLEATPVCPGSVLWRALLPSPAYERPCSQIRGASVTQWARRLACEPTEIG